MEEQKMDAKKRVYRYFSIKTIWKEEVTQAKR